MALLSNFFRSAIRPNEVWNIALHLVPNEFEIDRQLPNATSIFSSRQLRRNLRHIHTRADPFLLAMSDELYLFFEAVEINWHGTIQAYKTRDMITFVNIGTILEFPSLAQPCRELLGLVKPGGLPVRNFLAAPTSVSPVSRARS
jgi:hypothetical protein